MSTPFAAPLAVASSPSFASSRRVSPTAEVDALGERIAELSARLQAATYHLLSMIREFDERGGWSCGFRSCAHWLNWRTGIDLGAAREKVRVAHALAALPRLSAAMSRGEVSFSKVRALTRVATPENEAELLIFAKAGTAAHVERVVRGWRRVDRLVEAELEQQRHAGRYLQLHTDEDGMVVVRGRLSPEAGAALRAAIEAAEARLYDTRRAERAAARSTSDAPTAEQRRADAIGLVAESALAGGLDPGTVADRYQVVVHVDAESLPESADTGACLLGDGARVSAETSRRLACDAAIVAMRHAADGSVLDVGRRTRAISTPLRRALARRDNGCQFPGCGLRLCDAHHLQHWADGGKTKLENLIQLCRRHHRAVHEEGFRVNRLTSGELRFFRPDGKPLPASPEPPPIGRDTLSRLADHLAARDVKIDGTAGLPSWDGSPLDLAWAVDCLRAVGRRTSSEAVPRFGKPSHRQAPPC